MIGCDRLIGSDRLTIGLDIQKIDDRTGTDRLDFRIGSDRMSDVIGSDRLSRLSKYGILIFKQLNPPSLFRSQKSLLALQI